jgi:mannonate dehydratase
VEGEAGADRAYLERLTALASAGERRGRLLVLALDAVHREDGSPDLDATEFATPDEWVLAAARRRPDLFLAGISVHPCRRDAVERLEAGAAAGAVLLKWLPNAQRIDPASPRCDALYDRLAALRLPLLVHAGEEQAVVADGAQHLGNPLRLRRPLERGVSVVVAHCASLGEFEDLDAPAGARPRVPAFDLFLRLAREAGTGGRLRGDLSALAHWNRARHLPALLAARDLHPRLANGSDYPVPALDAVIHLERLVRLRVLDAALRAPLRELWERNVFWFDLALKRSLELGGVRFPPSVFMPDWLRRT